MTANNAPRRVLAQRWLPPASTSVRVTLTTSSSRSTGKRSSCSISSSSTIRLSMGTNEQRSCRSVASARWTDWSSRTTVRLRRFWKRWPRTNVERGIVFRISANTLSHSNRNIKRQSSCGWHKSWMPNESRTTLDLGHPRARTATNPTIMTQTRVIATRYVCWERWNKSAGRSVIRGG